MGHWQNSRAFKDVARRRERRLGAGEPPIRVGFVRGEVHLSSATVVEVLNRLGEHRLIGAIIAARPTHDWPGLHEWCWVQGIDLGYRWPPQLLRERLHGLVSLDAPNAFLDQVRARGLRIWQPLGPTLTRAEHEQRRAVLTTSGPPACSPADSRIA